jgi:hypothetical protein
MNPGPTPLSAKKKKPDKTPLTPILAPMPTPPVPTRGGIHVIHGAFVVGNALDDDWKSMGRYRFTSQRRGEKHVAKVEQNLVNARDSVSILKFNGTLELTGTTVTELDKDQFVRSVEQGVREHGQQSLFAIQRGTKVVDLLANHHLFSVKDVLTSIEHRESATDASAYDVYEEDDFGLSRLLVESKLGEPLREKIRIRYDHLNNFFELPGAAIFAMAMDICNASHYFDIEGAQERCDDLKLEDFQGEDVTACTAAAQKYIKVLQSVYAPPFRTGSKLLKKLTLSSCEEFNRKAFALLDLVKQMEGTYKLADPKLITQDTDYPTLGPIGSVAWAQKEHTQLVTDHEWPALAAKLPESNLAETNLAKATYASKVKDGVVRKFYLCGSEDHLRPECPQPPKEGENRGGPPPSAKPEEQRVRKALASWKYMQPHDLTKTYPDDDKK